MSEKYQLNDINFEMNNIDFNMQGCVVKVKGWKTFNGMVRQLKTINNKYKKLGVVGDFTIRLPLK